MHAYEKLGAFYLGKVQAAGASAPGAEPLLYDSRHLTTHAVVLGMTGSGKTGLGVALLEEAAIDGIPAIVIDPKGDMGNLLLTFPELRPEELLPWIDEREAGRQGVSPDELAGSVASRWRQGLADFGQDGARIQRLREAVEPVLYTPGSRAGVPISVLRSFAAPPPSVREQPDLLRDRIGGTVAGLLALAGITADPLRSREAILLGQILERAWAAGRGLDLPSLIRQVGAPPFAQVGVFDLESFFPTKDRFELALQLNALVASPGFSVWTEGEPLDVGRLLYGPSGKPRLSILSIAHLSDAERMFFVTLLLHEVVTWMRAQQGTPSLRALLYMDEIFGYFPPTAAPPSKQPMLTLLKQARAFGLGVVLATQNPVDLDYKGLANAGTWFVGRLQTERDKQRLLDGLEGALAASGHAFERAEMDRILSGLGARVFLMNDVHADGPVLFQTRWTLSYLAGPLSREQIQRLGARPAIAMPADSPPTRPGGLPFEGASPRAGSPSEAGARPVLPPDVQELFLVSDGALDVATDAATDAHVYQPSLFASARVRYASAKAGLDEWRPIALCLPLTGDELPSPSTWEQAELLGSQGLALGKEPVSGARFAPLPAGLAQKAQLEAWKKAFVQHVYESRPLRLLHARELGLVSRPGEDEGAFRQRLQIAAHERRDAEVEALRRRYAPRVQALQDKIARAEARLAEEHAEHEARRMDAAFDLGATVLGALVGRRGRGLGGVRSTLRSSNRAARGAADVARVEAELAQLRDRLRDLEASLEVDFRALHAAAAAALEVLLPIELRPRKSDVSVGAVALLWTLAQPCSG